MWRSGEEPCLPVVSKLWDCSLFDAKFFTKELTAAVLTIEDVCRFFRLTRINLLCDNTAAVAVMRKLCSATTVGNELARRIVKALEDSDCTLEVTHITSKHNPADEPSRSKPLVLEKIALAEKLLQQHDEGIVLNLEHKKFVPSKRYTTTGLRHDEENDGEHEESESEEDEVEEKLQREYDLPGLCCDF